jgi:Holliday junction resolvase
MESKIQKDIIKEAEKQGWYVVKIIQCNKNGFPDLLLMKNGRVIFIEVKDTGKQLRPLQEYRKKEIEKCGFEFFTLDNCKDLIYIL